MKYLVLILISSLLLYSCNNNTSQTEESIDNSKTGLLIIDAQKWYIPGHPESMYTLWGVEGNTSRAEKVIPAMVKTIEWANQYQLPVFVTYEMLDTGRYDLPDEISNILDSSRTTHYVKNYYGALKHKDFNEQINNSGITNWIIIGAETDVCVYQTAKGLLNQGMKVTLVSEATYSGKNLPQTALNNLEKFGAKIFSLNELDTLKSIDSIKSHQQVEQPLDKKNLELIFITDNNKTDTTSMLYKRQKFMLQYAEILQIPTTKTERITEVVSSQNTLLVMGNVSNKILADINSSNRVIIVSDVLNDLNKDSFDQRYEQATTKMIFYDLLEVADWYGKTPEQLTGWQKELKTAFNNGTLPYVESLQND